MGGPGSGRKKGYTLSEKPKRHENQLTAVARAVDDLPYHKKMTKQAGMFDSMVRRAKGDTL